MDFCMMLYNRFPLACWTLLHVGYCRSSSCAASKSWPLARRWCEIHDFFVGGWICFYVPWCGRCGRMLGDHGIYVAVMLVEDSLVADIAAEIYNLIERRFGFMLIMFFWPRVTTVYYHIHIYICIIVYTQIYEIECVLSNLPRLRS